MKRFTHQDHPLWATVPTSPPSICSKRGRGRGQQSLGVRGCPQVLRGGDGGGLEYQAVATAACGLGEGKESRASGHVMAGGGGQGRQSQAEGRGRFTMRVMSAAPVVMDGSAEKATVPHPPPPSHPLIHHHHHTVYTQATHSALQ